MLGTRTNVSSGPGTSLETALVIDDSDSDGDRIPPLKRPRVTPRAGPGGEGSPYSQAEGATWANSTTNTDWMMDASEVVRLDDGDEDLIEVLNDDIDENLADSLSCPICYMVLNSTELVRLSTSTLR